MTHGAGAPSIAPLEAPDGSILGVAVDHRDSFHAALRAAGVEHVDDALVAGIKADVVATLAPAATMVLLDHEVGLPAVQARGGLPDGVPFAVPLEAQGYGGLHEVVRTQAIPGFAATDAAAVGAAGCKLLLPLRTDVGDRAAGQVEVAAAMVAACHAAGLPLILEPVVWTAPGETLEPVRFAELVVAGAAILAPLAPGVLKLQYPGSAAACRDLHEACAGHPWVLLGGGALLPDLIGHVRDATTAGARGCIVGRSLFAAALDPDRARRRAELEIVSLPAFAALAAAIHR